MRRTPETRGKHVGRCPTHDKLLFPSRRDAKAAVRRHPNRRGMREYPCDAADGYYHVGHLPLAVMAGRKSVDEVYGRVSAAIGPGA